MSDQAEPNAPAPVPSASNSRPKKRGGGGKNEPSMFKKGTNTTVSGSNLNNIGRDMRHVSINISMAHEPQPYRSRSRQNLGEAFGTPYDGTHMDVPTFHHAQGQDTQNLRDGVAGGERAGPEQEVTPPVFRIERAPSAPPLSGNDGTRWPEVAPVWEMSHEEKNSLLETIEKQAGEIRDLRKRVKYMEMKEEQARQDADTMRDELRKLKEAPPQRAADESSRRNLPQPKAEGSHRTGDKTRQNQGKGSRGRSRPGRYQPKPQLSSDDSDVSFDYSSDPEAASYYAAMKEMKGMSDKEAVAATKAMKAKSDKEAAAAMKALEAKANAEAPTYLDAVMAMQARANEGVPAYLDAIKAMQARANEGVPAYLDAIQAMQARANEGVPAYLDAIKAMQARSNEGASVYLDVMKAKAKAKVDEETADYLVLMKATKAKEDAEGAAYWATMKAKSDEENMRRYQQQNLYGMREWPPLFGVSGSQPWSP